jgi:hypothetical protein
MLGSSPFFKTREDMSGKVMPSVMPHRNYGARPSVGHPRYGFQTMLNQDSFGKLPTAPAVVGGNVMWTRSQVTPATQYLHSVLSGGRPMNPAPALGSALRLMEPTINSIHTHY